MKISKRPPVFVVVDDDDPSRETLVSLCKNAFPACRFFDFDSLAEACRAVPKIDVLLVDTSAMACGAFDFNYSALANFHNCHPSADVFIMSGMSRNAVENLIEDLQHEYEVDTRFFHSVGFLWETILLEIKEKSNSMTGTQRSGKIE